MKAVILVLAGLLIVTGTLSAQEQEPTFYGPSTALKKIYYRISHGPHRTGVDVRTYEICPDCGQAHDPEVECIQRVPCPDCVIGKKRLFCGSVHYEYVVVAEVRYRWKTKWITKEVPADFQDPICNTEDGDCLHNVEDWTSCDTCEGKMYCQTTKSDPDGVEIKRIECEPGQTTIKVRYKSCVKEPYTVYRQIRRPIAVKQPCYEKVEVPITRYIGQRLKPNCD